MTSGFEHPSPQNYAETILHSSQTALREAVAIVSPGNPEADPLQIFPAPSEVRDESQGLTLTEEQARSLRVAVAPLGFERPGDVTLSELGLYGATVIIEGGQPHKIVAEARMVAQDAAAEPLALIFSASPFRKITSAGERASAERQFGQVPETEYDVARLAAQMLSGFQPVEEDLVLPVGYDINNGFEVSDSGGQLVQIGNVVNPNGSVPVMMLRVDREDYVDAEGKTKYRNQPGAGDVMSIVHRMTQALGQGTSPVAFVTSGTYQPSRQVDAAMLSLQTDRLVGVATYGVDLMLDVNGEMPAPKRLDQLPGELHVMAQEVLKLEQVLSSQE